MSPEIPYRYTGLKPREQIIRLVSLYPGQFSDDVFVSISHVDLNDANYEALSYTWGPPTQHTRNLYIRPKQSSTESSPSGCKVQILKIRPSLLEALRYLRYPDATRVLWIDAVCINQQSLSERSQEVPRMGEIYNRAQQVVVWLGPDENRTHTALETVEDLSAGVIVPWHRRNITTVPGTEADLVKHYPEQSTLSLAQWAALKGLLTRPWFQRLWVRQEVTLASKVVVRCGPFEAAWEDFEKVALLLEHSHVKSHISLRDVLFCRWLFAYHGSDKLSYVLHRSSLCGYSERHDLVYANLALSPAISALHIEPDYTLPFAVAYQDLVYKYLKHWGTLEILRSCNIQTALEGVGSFVPNFSVPKSQSHLMANTYASGGTRQFPLECNGNSTLHLIGKYIATIDYVSEVRKPPAGDFVQRETNLEVFKSFHRWEPDDLFTADYPTGGTLFDAFVLLLAGGVIRDIYDSPNNATIEECREAFLAVAWSGGNLDLIGDRKYWPYLKELISDRRAEVFFRCAEGHIGLSPAVVQQGDIAVVLVGGNDPYVLRPNLAGDSDSYRVVGPCFLQGVMSGEGLFGPLSEQWVCTLDGDTLQFCFRDKRGGVTTWEDPRLWPLPFPWQVHFCNISAETNTCCGEYSEKPEGDAGLKNRHFLKTETQQRSEHDPRLDLVGLENGRILLEKYILI